MDEMSMNGDKTISGGCHCGQIRYSFTTQVSCHNLAYRMCSCGYCRRQGAVYTSDPDGRLDIQCMGPVSVYQFAGKDVEFVSCPVCGVLTYVLYRENDRNYAVLNANTFDTIPADRTVTVKNFTDESREAAGRRRKQNWIGHVNLHDCRTSTSADNENG